MSNVRIILWHGTGYITQLIEASSQCCISLRDNARHPFTLLKLVSLKHCMTSCVSQRYIICGAPSCRPSTGVSAECPSAGGPVHGFSTRMCEGMRGHMGLWGLHWECRPIRIRRLHAADGLESNTVRTSRLRGKLHPVMVRTRLAQASTNRNSSRVDWVQEGRSRLLWVDIGGSTQTGGP